MSIRICQFGEYYRENAYAVRFSTGKRYYVFKTDSVWHSIIFRMKRIPLNTLHSSARSLYIARSLITVFDLKHSSIKRKNSSRQQQHHAHTYLRVLEQHNELIIHRGAYHKFLTFQYRRCMASFITRRLTRKEAKWKKYKAKQVRCGFRASRRTSSLLPAGRIVSVRNSV